jgi:hypothetical protein
MSRSLEGVEASFGSFKRLERIAHVLDQNFAGRS